MAVVVGSPNDRFTQRLIALGIIPQHCAEWTLTGKPDDIWTMKATVYVSEETLAELQKAVEEEKPQVVEEIVIAAGNLSVGPFEIPRHLHAQRLDSISLDGVVVEQH